MPPPHSGESLTSEQIDLLTKWIDQGAERKRHWSFVAPARPTPPINGHETVSQHPVDAFVIAQLQAKDWEPMPTADRRTLIRRASLDLTGLPPSLSEVEEFLNDPASLDKAFARVVDRLLASPQIGEHMAVDWLQIARFADSNGFQNDFRREMWPWRDWVINAFNSNMPFDQFNLEQNAGDLLPNATRSQVIATGFHRNNRTVTESNFIARYSQALPISCRALLTPSRLPAIPIIVG